MKKNRCLNSPFIWRLFNLCLFVFLFTALHACDKDSSGTPKEEEPSASEIDTTGMELIFNSGFEPSVEVVNVGTEADIIGIDESFSDKNDWSTDLDNNPMIGNFTLQYQGGDETQRIAKVIEEPGNESNHVLQFWLDDSNVGGSKGRIQANIYGNEGIKEIFQSTRLFLSSDFNTVCSYPGTIDWLTIAEFWNNITWSQDVPYGFRITLTISKPSTGDGDLYFKVEAQDCELFGDDSQEYETVWSRVNYAVKVPVGEWFTMEYYLKEGDAENGRYYLAITTQDGVTSEIFNLTKSTHNTNDPDPDGITEFNPLKLYTSKSLIDYMRSEDKSLEIYWDDFILKCKK